MPDLFQRAVGKNNPDKVQEALYKKNEVLNKYKRFSKGDNLTGIIT